MSGAIRAEQIRIAAGRNKPAGVETAVVGVVVDAIFEGERIVYEVEVPALGGAVLRVFDHDAENHQQFEPGRRSQPRLECQRHAFFQKVNL